MEWISVEDEFPKEAGHYNTKVSVGSIAPKVEHRVSRFIVGTYPRFSSGDWIRVTHWRRGKINF